MHLDMDNTYSSLPKTLLTIGTNHFNKTLLGEKLLMYNKRARFTLLEGK